MEIGDGLMWIGFNGDRWWVDGDQCWWSACDGLTEKRKEKDSQKKKKRDGEEREAEIKIRIVWRRRRRGYSEKREGLGGGRWEIIKKVRENIILIKSVYNR